jgi:glucose/arabinose dehydrogenase
VAVASIMACLRVLPPPEVEPMPPPQAAARARARIVALLVASLSLLVLGAAPASAAEPTLRATIVQRNLVNPWDIAFAPDGRMFVTERPGRIRVFASGAASAPIRRTFTIPNVRAEGEAGAMGLALDPRFASNGLLYVCVSRTDGGQWRNQVLRYRVSGSSSFAFDRYVIRTGMRASSNHNGCAMELGRDGKLYVSMGDAERPADAQNPTRLNGKILRLNADGSVPSDNPILPGAPGRSAVFSIGHRNPQGIAIQASTGRRYAAEHGPDVHDELNLLIAGSDYGWPELRGPEGKPGFRDPCWSSGGSTIATSGAAFAPSATWGDFQHQLFVTTLKEQDLRRFTLTPDGRLCREAGVYFDGTFGRLRAITPGPGGALFVSTSNGNGDRIVRITPGLTSQVP